MVLSRRQVLRGLALAGGGGLLYVSGITPLLKGCARIAEPDPETPAADDSFEPAYLQLEAEGQLQERVERAQSILESCRLCPRVCGVNRLAGEQGFCRAPGRATVYSAGPHLGEEVPLVGRAGSGTIFFSHCNLRCVFCQNWPIAHQGLGNETSDQELADMMLRLQDLGCHNINLVTPTHFMPSILAATRIALQRGLRLPLCYNTSGYELVEMLELLDGVVDIYLPDLKFMDGEQASRYNLAAAEDYPDRARQAIREMHRQVGDLVTDRGGIAQRGLMVRHLVMPNNVAGTDRFVQFVASDLSTTTYVNIMSQYRVEFLAFEYDEIARAITSAEYVQAMEWAQEAGLTRLDERSLSQLQLHQRRLGN